MKKLREGDCSFGTLKLILGWIIDTINMTIQLPQHRVDRLAEILNSIPATQRRTSVKKWYSILGELRSMALALPGPAISSAQCSTPSPTKPKVE
jgi:hypothetical protein